jgi:hypothetical protein
MNFSKLAALIWTTSFSTKMAYKMDIKLLKSPISVIYLTKKCKIVSLITFKVLKKLLKLKKDLLILSYRKIKAFIFMNI